MCGLAYKSVVLNNWGKWLAVYSEHGANDACVMPKPFRIGRKIGFFD